MVKSWNWIDNEELINSVYSFTYAVCTYITVWYLQALLLHNTCQHSQEAMHQQFYVLWQVIQILYLQKL